MQFRFTQLDKSLRPFQLHFYILLPYFLPGLFNFKEWRQSRWRVKLQHAQLRQNPKYQLLEAVSDYLLGEYPNWKTFIYAHPKKNLMTVNCNNHKRNRQYAAFRNSIFDIAFQVVQAVEGFLILECGLQISRSHRRYNGGPNRGLFAFIRVQDIYNQQNCDVFLRVVRGIFAKDDIEFNMKQAVEFYSAFMKNCIAQYKRCSEMRERQMSKSQEQNRKVDRKDKQIAYSLIDWSQWKPLFDKEIIEYTQARVYPGLRKLTQFLNQVHPEQEGLFQEAVVKSRFRFIIHSMVQKIVSSRQFEELGYTMDNDMKRYVLYKVDAKITRKQLLKLFYILPPEPEELMMSKGATILVKYIDWKQQNLFRAESNPDKFKTTSIEANKCEKPSRKANEESSDSENSVWSEM